MKISTAFVCRMELISHLLEIVRLCTIVSQSESFKRQKHNTCSKFGGLLVERISKIPIKVHTPDDGVVFITVVVTDAIIPPIIGLETL